MAEESLYNMFAESVPDSTCSRIERMERIPRVAVMDHLGKFLEVAEVDSDGTGGKDYLVGSSHVLHALSLTDKILSASLIVTVRAVESCFNMIDIDRGHKGVPVFKKG